jgi:hypothetical protein
VPIDEALCRRAQAPDPVELALAGVVATHEGGKEKRQRRKRDEELDGHLIGTSISASSSSNFDVRTATVAVQSPGAVNVAAEVV